MKIDLKNLLLRQLKKRMFNKASILFVGFYFVLNICNGQITKFKYGDTMYMYEQSYFNIHHNETIRWYLPKENLKDGSYSCLKENNNLRLKFTIKNGHFIDTFFNYFADTNAFEELVIYRNGISENNISYHRNGKIKIIGKKFGNAFNGKYQEFDTDEKLIVLGQFSKDGNRQGIWSYFSDSILITKGKYKNDLKNGKWRFYSKTFKELIKIEFYNNRGFLYKIRFKE